MSGEFHDIPINENVVSLARWAVDEYNTQQQTNLAFGGVWSAQEQIVAGIRYRIVLDASDEGRRNRYGAQVLVTPSNDRELEDFYAILRGEA